MYEAIDITLRAGKKYIIKDAGLTIKAGQVTSIIGPNGAGKSSLLKVLSNELPDYKGSVLVNGTCIKDYTPKALSRIRAVMAQHANLQFAFTVRQVIALARHGHLSSSRDNQVITDEVMDITGIAPFADRNYLTLSGGEKQRVQLARVLTQVWEETQYPRYILLDEPTSSMDIAQQQFMFSIVKKICARNIGVLAVVHDLNLAAQFAEYLYLMRDGKIVASGRSEDVFTKANIEETFCCAVNIYRDPCNNCPYIIPERMFVEPASTKLMITHA